MKNVYLAIIAIAGMITGCAYNASYYASSVQNAETIKRLNIKPVAITQFRSSRPGLSSITCRAAGSVNVKPNFENYIEKAFIDELKRADAYDPASTVILTGMLEEVDFSSGMTDGNWTFVLTISNHRNESFTTNSKFEFSGSFVADVACEEVSRLFCPAVQKLIQDVVKDPKFSQIAN